MQNRSRLLNLLLFLFTIFIMHFFFIDKEGALLKINFPKFYQKNEELEMNIQEQEEILI